MRIRAATAALGAAVVTAASTVPGAVAAAADVHPDAATITHTGRTHLLGSPSQSDWYALPGALDKPGIGGTLTTVEIDPLNAPTGCDGQRPLLVSLYNADGHWIQDVGAQQGPPRYALADPYLPVRYLLQVSLQDPGCASLQYSIRTVVVPITGTSQDSKNAAVDFCRVDRQIQAQWQQARDAMHKHSAAYRRADKQFRAAKKKADSVCKRPVHV